MQERMSAKGAKDAMKANQECAFLCELCVFCGPNVFYAFPQIPGAITFSAS